MQVVITIPDGYKELTNIQNGSIACKVILDAVKNGIILPDDHGRLIDADLYLRKERPRGISDDLWENSYTYRSITGENTVIPKEKEV